MSRHALPAIFWTTPSATDTCPSPMVSESLAAGLVSVPVVEALTALVMPYVGLLIGLTPIRDGVLLRTSQQDSPTGDGACRRLPSGCYTLPSRNLRTLHRGGTHHRKIDPEPMRS